MNEFIFFIKNKKTKNRSADADAQTAHYVTISDTRGHASDDARKQPVPKWKITTVQIIIIIIITMGIGHCVVTSNH